MTATVPNDNDSSRQFDVERVGGDEPGTLADDVATEEPLEIRLGYTGPDGERAQKNISVTMRTPGNDDELAAGFLFTEGIVRRSADVDSIATCGPPAVTGSINVVRVELADDVGHALVAASFRAALPAFSRR